MEALQTVAEIAVTLIGFVGIFLAFSAERARTSKAELVDFLLSAIGATVFAFLPVVLSGVVGQHALWRLSCGLFGVFHLAIWTWSVRAHLAVRRFSVVEWSFTAASLFVVGLKLAVGAGFLVIWGYQIYLLGLVWLILNCILGFYGFMARALWEK
jgi:hypothetical protein